MYTKSITYIDYNGNERTEDASFNLTQAELMEMEMGTTGGMAAKINKIIQAQDTPEIINLFKDLILRSYGVKSDDGRRFIKTDASGNPLSVAFSQTEAYSKLFIELGTDDNAAAEFINGIMPSAIVEEAAKQNLKLVENK